MSFLYSFEMWCLKAAFLSLFYDLKVHLDLSLRRLLYIVTAFTGLTFIGNVVFQVAFCRPISTIWYVFLYRNQRIGRS